MANDLDRYSQNAPAPYSPAPVAPISPQGGNSGQAIDLLRGGELRPAQSVRQNNSQTWFGTSVPGLTPEVADQIVGKLSAMFVQDFQVHLKHPAKWVNAAVAYMSACYGETPQQEPKRHAYNLYELTGDVLMENLANHLSRVGASQAFLTNLVWWSGELGRRAEQVSGAPNPAKDGNSNFGSPNPQNYTDAEWNRIVEASERQAAKTETALRNKYGNRYDSVIASANAELAKLTPAQQKHLSQVTSQGVGLNQIETVEGLYKQSLGAALPASRTAINSEINEIENVLKTDRRRYMKSPEMQNRLLELYRLRGD